MNPDIVIKNAHIITMDENEHIITNGYIMIENQSIVEIGSMDQFPKVSATQILDVHGSFVLPGLVNTHTHLPMVLMRGQADDMNLSSFLQTVFKYEEEITKDDAYYASLLACFESILSGVTCVNDMYFYESSVAQACIDSGIRAVISYGMIDLFSDEVDKKREEELQKAQDFLNKWQDKHDRISVSVAPHAPYSCSDELLQKSKKLAQRYGITTHIHIAETKKEKHDIEELEDTTPVQYLDDIGFFEQNKVVAAHCVWVDEEDLEIFRKHRVGVSHNPSSNMKLASGFAPIPEMLERGLTVGLGTDGTASNDNLSVLFEARLAGLIHKGNTLDAKSVPAKELLKMATINGAKILGLEHSIGSLEVGKKADLAIFKKGINVNPTADEYASIIYALKEYNLSYVIVNGKLVLADKKIVNQTLYENTKKTFYQVLLDLNQRVHPNQKEKFARLMKFFDN